VAWYRLMSWILPCGEKSSTTSSASFALNASISSALPVDAKLPGRWRAFMFLP